MRSFVCGMETSRSVIVFQAHWRYWEFTVTPSSHKRHDMSIMWTSTSVKYQCFSLCRYVHDVLTLCQDVHTVNITAHVLLMSLVWTRLNWTSRQLKQHKRLKPETTRGERMNLFKDWAQAFYSTAEIHSWLSCRSVIYANCGKSTSEQSTTCSRVVGMFSTR